MLLVVCPNLAIDRILEVDGFQSGVVQRSKSVLTQPGGKGSNVARVFRQLGGEVSLVGFAGRANARCITEPLSDIGIRVTAIPAYDQDTRTATIICDRETKTHPTVINEESPEIERGAAGKLLATVERLLPRMSAVLVTGSLSTGLPLYFYTQILLQARTKLTAIDASGAVLRAGLEARPTFMKPNAEEFTKMMDCTSLVFLPQHSVVTFGEKGAGVINAGSYMQAAPPYIQHVNPIGAGDAFTAAYLKILLGGGSAADALKWAVAAAFSDAGTLRPGMVNREEVEALHSGVEVRFTL